MGIVNANPDSFSDAVRLTRSTRRSSTRARLVADGADLIDVGGESGVTYTGRRPPRRSSSSASCRSSRRLAAEGVDGLRRHLEARRGRAPRWRRARASSTTSRACATRRSPTSRARPARRSWSCTPAPRPSRRGSPTTAATSSRDVAARSCASAARWRATAAWRDEQLIVDPGPDFAKTPAETVEVLRALERLREALGRPVLAAISRKYFLGAITGRAARRAPGRHARGARRRRRSGRRRSSASTTSPRPPTSSAVRAVLTGARGARVPSTSDDDGLKWIRDDALASVRTGSPAAVRNAAGRRPTPNHHRRNPCPS